jgi:hypothetical protein
MRVLQLELISDARRFDFHGRMRVSAFHLVVPLET